MTRSSVVAERTAALLDATVVATAPVAGGDICVANRLRLSTGASVFVKTLSPAPAGFFRAEAAGLGWLGETTGSGGVTVPQVLAVEDDCLILAWVETGRPTPEAAESFGRALALTHRSGAQVFGTESGTDGWVGVLPLPNRPADSWPEFFATRRLLPYLKLAVDRRAIEPEHARAVEDVVRRIVDLAGPPEPPARLHGDLWGGNLLWPTAGGRVTVVDPAAHGGHRESDLALLALFGCPQLTRVLAGYGDVDPLADGWPERVPLHQLFPLLVHAALFDGGSGGAGYGARAGAAARSQL